MVDSQIHDEPSHVDPSKEDKRTTGDVSTREIIELLQADKDELGIDDEFMQHIIQLLQEGENSTADMIERDSAFPGDNESGNRIDFTQTSLEENHLLMPHQRKDIHEIKVDSLKSYAVDESMSEEAKEPLIITSQSNYPKKDPLPKIHDQSTSPKKDSITESDLFQLEPNYNNDQDSRDVFFDEAGRYIIEKNKASIGLIQRAFKIGFNRAARIMDQLAEAGVVSEESSTSARAVLMSLQEYEEFLREKEDLDQHTYIANIEKTKDIEAKYTALLKKRNLNAQFSVDSIVTLVKNGNCIIPECGYNLPFDFVDSVLEKCIPGYYNLILVDDKGLFYLYDLYPSTFPTRVSGEKWILDTFDSCISDRNSRQRIWTHSNRRKHYGKDDIITSLNKPTVIVVRELYGILQITGMREKLLDLLINSDRFGIVFIGFSQYSLLSLRIQDLKTIVPIKDVETIKSLLMGIDETKHTAIDNIDVMTGIEFEKFCSRLLAANGFQGIYITKASGDYGADIIATKNQIKYVIQCKRSNVSIGVQAVQEVLGSRSIYNCHVGVVLTNNLFTSNAKQLAKTNNVILWDAEDIQEMMKALN